MLARAPVIRLELDSVQSLIKTYATLIADGQISVDQDAGMPAGTAVEVLVDTRDVGVFEGAGRVLGRAAGRTQVSLAIPRRLRNFIHARAIERRQGRVAGAADGRRVHVRYDTYLPVRVLEGSPLMGEAHVSNVSRGGLFVVTEAPPLLGSRMRVELTLPRGPALVDLLVTRVEASEEEAAHGFGAAFVNEEPLFTVAIERLLADYAARAPRVLVVEDDRFFRQALVTELTTAGGAHVSEAVDGEEGLAQLRERLLELDLVVMDLMMPKLGGPELLVRLRGMAGAIDLPVVVLSGVRNEYLEALREEGLVADVIEKRYGIPELVARIGRVLKRTGLR